MGEDEKDLDELKRVHRTPDPDAPLETARFRVQGLDGLPVAERRQKGPIPVMTHSRAPDFPDTRQFMIGEMGISAPFLTVCGASVPDIFDV